MYLLKEKSKIEFVFKKFYMTIETQLQVNIQILQSDNGRKYFTKKSWGNILRKRGLCNKVLIMIHHNKMEWQKEKKKHILEVTCAQTFSNNVPTYL